MQENEFEKQVHHKLNDLKVKPSEQVWQHVADAIVKRKTERKIFVIVLLCLLIATGGIFLLNNTSSQHKDNALITADNNALKNSKEIKLFNNGDSIQIGEPQKKSVTIGTDSISDLLTTSKGVQVLKIQNSGKEFSQLQQSEKAISSAKQVEAAAGNTAPDEKEKLNHSNKVAYRTTGKIRASIKNALPSDSFDEELTSGETHTTIVIDKILPLNDMKSVGKFLNPGNKIDLENKVNNPFTIKAKVNAVSNSPLKRVIPLQQKHPWKIGLNFSLGVSSTRKGYLGIVGSGNGNVSRTYASADPVSSGCGNCSNNAASYQPSVIKPSMGLILGIFVQKNISSKSAFSIGFNYKMYNSIMMTGSRVDSAVIVNSNSSYLLQNDFFYRPGISTRYKNYFHFLEMPLAGHIKLGRQNKHPVYLNTGISIAQLIASNALQFDTASAKYYSNNSLFNKTQIGISAGVLFSLSGNANNPFLVGPDIHFSLNKLSATGLYQSSNYSYFGIQIQKIFGKK